VGNGSGPRQINKDSSQEAKSEIQDKIKAKEKHPVSPSDEQHIEDTEVARAINKMPEPFRQTFLAMTRTISRGMPYHPLFDKFTPEHTSQFLENIRKDDENEYRLKSSNRWFYVIYAFFDLVFLLFLIVFLLPKDKDFLNKIIETLIVLGGGFGAGYGVKSWQNKMQ
jgi:hypothetical protein